MKQMHSHRRRAARARALALLVGLGLTVAAAGPQALQARAANDETIECDNLALAPILSGLCLFGGGAAGTGAESYAFRVQAGPLPVDTGKVARAAAPAGETAEKALVRRDIRDLLHAGAGEDHAQADPAADHVSATATSEIADVSLAGGAVQAHLVRAVATAEYTTSTGTGSSASDGSLITGLVVNGTPVRDPAPNTTIPVPGVGTLVVHEDIDGAGAGHSARQVRMLHLYSEDRALDIVVASAFAAAGAGFDANGPAPTKTPDLPGPPPTPVFSDGFEGGTTNWATHGKPIWEIGVPTSGPNAAHSGTKVAATYLGSDYPNSSAGGLVSPSIDLPVVPAVAGSKPLLRFWSWFQSESYYDCGVINLSADGGATWTKLTPVDGYNYNFTAFCGGRFEAGSFSGNLAAWHQYRVDLSDYAGQKVLLAFDFASDSSVTAPGWYIDDVEVTLER
jgi:hypothetical protein